jgi:SAM-dependent methyltransferase
MRKSLASTFTDPRDGGPLTLDIAREDDSHVLEGALVAADGHRYPILGGVPRFVNPVLYADRVDAEDDTTQTGASFGDKWTRPEYLDYGRLEIDRRRRARTTAAMLGLEDPDGLLEMLAGDIRVLDAGCGVGAAEYLFNEDTRAERYAFDLSLAADRAFANTRERTNVCIAQGDILAPPFAPGTFDLIFSEGVIHHTGDTPRAFHNLARLLRPGGRLGIYVYCVKPLIREMADQTIRAQTTEMSFEDCHAFGEQVAALGRALQRIGARVEIDVDVPLLGIEAGEYDVQAFIYEHFLKCYYNDEQGLARSTLNNVDWYHPKHATHHTRDEVDGWFAEAGLVDVRYVDVPGWKHSGYFVSGSRPS